MSPVFIILSTLTLLSALGVIFNRNPIYSALHLVLCFFSIAGHYLYLNAPFLAAIQIIVYAGAIMVLFLFMLMLFNLNQDSVVPSSFSFKLNVGAIITLMIGSLVSIALLHSFAGNATPPIEGSIHALGKLLFTIYALPFELSSVLFL